MISRILNASCTLIPLALVLLWPSLSAYEFSPRRVLHSLDTRALLFAPWVCRASAYALVSRIIQAAIVLRAHNLVVVHAYALWFAIAGARTLEGWLLTRAVGWAYPPLFSHSSLYETASGLGPPLVTLLVLSGVRRELPSRRINVVEPLVLAAICAVLTWLDDAPWTYATAVLLLFPVAIVGKLLPAEKLLPTPMERTAASTRARHILPSMLACAALIVVPRLLPSPYTHSAVFPRSPGPRSLLDVLVVSYPRPHDNSASPILNTTLSSLLPLTAVPGIALAVFTHADPAAHPAFAWAQAHFPQVEFYADRDAHPEASAGQHLHVAEALRWASARVGGAEWVMLLEDDFPLCDYGGSRGIDSLARVMQALEVGRHRDPDAEWLERRGAFVGTGGSGLIFHHTLLPIASMLLKLHASTQSALPPDVRRRPADLVMQDCLLGVDPLCPRRKEVMEMHPPPFSGNTTASPAPTSGGEAESLRARILAQLATPNTDAGGVREGGNLVITARMILDHVGAAASTAPGRRYGADQWRCGWRHPFHGRDEVVVVVG
ncbi:hypothetical protein C8R43DRAFT_994701 [Mycena crocata]|nr:hypothetical protein C8R43DRAFT_994701 [Mycena crocata]